MGIILQSRIPKGDPPRNFLRCAQFTTEKVQSALIKSIHLETENPDYSSKTIKALK